MRSEDARLQATLIHPERVDRNCDVGGGAEPCPAACCRTPNQLSPDLPTGRVSTAGLSSTARPRHPEPIQRGSRYISLDLAHCAMTGPDTTI